MITKIDDIKALVLEGRSDPTRVLPRLRALAASESWQEREVAATALVHLAKRHPEAVTTAASKWAKASDANVRRAASEAVASFNATRTQPDFVFALCTDWARSTNPHTRWIVRDGLRKMKATHPARATVILESLGAQD